MPNIATVLKSEITRVARKEARAENAQLKKVSSQYRADIAALKRRILGLEKLIKDLAKPTAKRLAAATAEAPALQRFSAKGLAAQRKRLGLTASQFGALLGVSDQSIYKWEDAKSRPRSSHLPAIATIRLMTKKEAAARLAKHPSA